MRLDKENRYGTMAAMIFIIIVNLSILILMRRKCEGLTVAYMLVKLTDVSQRHEHFSILPLFEHLGLPYDTLLQHSF